MSAHETTPIAEVARSLAETTLSLVATESVSRNETAIANLVAEMLDFRLPSLLHDDSLFYEPERRANTPLLVLAGHLDTVPPQGNLPERLEDGAVHGLGSSDMKGALAVMVEIARWLDRQRSRTALDVGFLFFAREELPIDESPITGLLHEAPLLSESNLVVIMEPTSNAIQLGCLGNLNADVIFKGTSSHSARPWLGDNAIHSAIENLQRVAASSAQAISVDGLNFYEVVNVTGMEGGIARNVIPDKIVCHLNYRYAPNRSPDEAESALRELVGDDASLDVIGNAPPGRVAIDNPLVGQLQAAAGASIEPKQAWTNVAEFSAAGIDAVNFGPGDPEYAHRADEQVAVDALVESYLALQLFISGAD